MSGMYGLIGMYILHLASKESKSLSSARSHGRRLQETYCDVNEFEPQVYVGKRVAEGAANATINREMEIYKQAIAMYNRLWPDSAYHVKYVPHLHENNTRQGFFELNDWKALRLFLPEWLELFCEFAYYTGWRKSEIAGLRWEWVNGDIRIPDSKNGSGRVIPIAGPVAKVISKARERKLPSSPWVFHFDGEKIRDFRRTWALATQRAGLVGHLFHDFRRTAVRNMIEAGVDREVAKKITGHKTDSMFTRYQIVDKRQMAAALEKL